MSALFLVNLLSVFASPLVVILVIVTIMGHWMVLKDMGRRPWVALIPVFGTYEICQGASGSPGLAAAAVVVGILDFLPVEWKAAGVAWVGTLITLASLAVECVMSYKLARAFGMGAGFTVALVLVPFVAYPYLSLGSPLYHGPVDVPREA